MPGWRALRSTAWPKPEAWMAKVFAAAVGDARVRERPEQARCYEPVVATILPPRYGMKGMYYVRSPAGHRR